ncbi:hypothetical protein BaRGS_00004987, partial [Batillaria attramentaria]
EVCDNYCATSSGQRKVETVINRAAIRLGPTSGPVIKISRVVKPQTGGSHIGLSVLT